MLEIRDGKYSLTELQEWGAQLAAQANSPLPDAVAREAINELMPGRRSAWGAMGPPK
jgi:hypothetical protein